MAELVLDLDDMEISVTLALATHRRGNVIVAADLRVTKAGRIWDAQASKIVVIVCYDGVAALAYTGVAYIEGVATDEWIARQLVSCYHRTSEFKSDAIMIAPYSKIRLGAALKIISERLHHAVSKLRYPFHVVLGGAKVRDRRVFAFTDCWVAVQKAPRYSRLRRYDINRAKLLAVGDPGNITQLEDFFEKSAVGLESRNPGESLAIQMIETIKWRSKQCRTVGEAVHVVLISHQKILIGFWRDYQFNPKLHHHKIMNLQGADTYTPWIVTGNHAVPPQLINLGVFEFESESWKIIARSMGQPAALGGTAGMGAAQRKRPT